MQAQEIGNKVAQRLWFGASVFHPSAMATWNLLDLPQLAKMNEHASIDEMEKYLAFNKVFVKELGRVPNFQFPQGWQTATQIVGYMTKDQVQQNKQQVVQQLLELQKQYEEGTLQMLQQIKEIGKELGEGMKHFIARAVSSVAEEVKEIQLTKEAMEKLGFDPEKIKKDGGHDMRYYGEHDHEHEHEMARRHRSEMEHMARRHHAERMDGDMGYSMRRGGRHHSDIELPHLDHEDEYSMRRGVRGTGRYSRYR